MSFNRLEWIVADLGTMLAGGIVVPIYHTNTPDQCAYIIQDAGARFVVVEDTVQLAKVLSSIERLENLARIILIEGETPAAAEKVISFRELLNRGRKHDRSDVNSRTAKGRSRSMIWQLSCIHRAPPGHQKAA